MLEMDVRVMLARFTQGHVVRVRITVMVMAVRMQMLVAVRVRM